MPIVKAISGHTSCKGVYCYLTRKNRALASDFINLDVPERAEGRPFDWAKVMDETRHRNGNDRAWGGSAARTYKHYILSPDPEDNIDLDGLRELAMKWAEKHFGDYEVAIVYHNDNASHIPHAHVIVNNTNLSTGNRLQDPDPKMLKHSAQRMAKERGLHDLDTQMPDLDSRQADRFRHPATRQSVRMGREELAIGDEGGYSWVADIRHRVDIARSIARNEREFRSVLGSIGVEVSDNSPNAARRDWVYSMADRPARRISGEKLGARYGREGVVRHVGGAPYGHLSDASERRIAAIARKAFEVGSAAELERLAEAVGFLQEHGALGLDELQRAGAGQELIDYVRDNRLLPEHQETSVRPRVRGDSYLDEPEPDWKRSNQDGSRSEEPRNPDRDRASRERKR